MDATQILNLPIEIWQENILPNAASPLPKKIGNGHHGIMALDIIPLLDKAHTIAEQWINIRKLSLVDKSCHTWSDKLGKQVVAIVKEIQHKNSGYIQYCMNVGLYLTVFKIYFTYFPQAMTQSFEKIWPYQECKFNLIHNAILYHRTNKIPDSFLLFLLRINQHHQIGLLNEEDAGGLKPLYRAFRMHDIDSYLSRMFNTASHTKKVIPDIKIISMLLEYDPQGKQNLNALLPPPASAEHTGRLPIIYDLFDDWNSNNNEQNAKEQLIDLLLEQGADINLQNEQGNTIFHALAAHQRFDGPTIQKLLDKGANPNIRNHQGYNVLELYLKTYFSPYPNHSKSDANLRDNVQLLIQRGAEVPDSLKKYLLSSVSENVQKSEEGALKASKQIEVLSHRSKGQNLLDRLHQVLDRVWKQITYIATFQWWFPLKQRYVINWKERGLACPMILSFRKWLRTHTHR